MLRLERWIPVICAVLLLGVTACAGPQDSGQQEDAELQQKETTQQERIQYASSYEPVRPAEKIEQMDTDLAAQTVQEKYRDMMVKVQVEDLIGSGVIYDADGESIWIVTAGHVFSQSQDPVEITFADGYSVTADSFWKSESHDAALIRVPYEKLAGRADRGRTYLCARVFPEAYDRAAAGDEVVAMGSYTGVGEDAYAGRLTADCCYLEDFESYMMLADVPVKPGMSGGGLFDTEGNLLGIICGVSEDGEVAAVRIIDLYAMRKPCISSEDTEEKETD